MQGFTTIDLAILVVYLAAVLFAGLHFSKKEMQGKEFFKGDGTIPWWVTSVSILKLSLFLIPAQLPRSVCVLRRGYLSGYSCVCCPIPLAWPA